MNIRDAWVQRSAFVCVLLAAGCSLPEEPPDAGALRGATAYRPLVRNTSAGESTLAGHEQTARPGRDDPGPDDPGRDEVTARSAREPAIGRPAGEGVGRFTFDTPDAAELGNMHRWRVQRLQYELTDFPFDGAEIGAFYRF